MDKKIILLSHGDLAKGMKNTLSMLVGDADEVSSYSLMPGESPEELVLPVFSEVKNSPDTFFYIIADIMGGSVSNALARLSCEPNVRIVNGMNLPLVIGVHFLDGNVSDDEFQQILEDARQGLAQTILRDAYAEDEESEII